MMNSYSIFLSSITFLTSLFLIALFVFVFSRQKKSKVNLSFSLICFSATVWLLSYSKAYSSLNQEEALFWFRIGFPGVVFIAITYFHFTNVLLAVRQMKWIIVFNYVVGGFLIFLIS